MARGYTPIEAKVLEQFLAERGFRRTVQGSEIVYIRDHHSNAAVKVKVYTSIRAGEAVARGSGKDAIRVTAAYEGEFAVKPAHNKPPSKNFGLYASQRIFRTGGDVAILERLLERMREAYSFTNHWLQNHWRDVTEARSKANGAPLPPPPTKPPRKFKPRPPVGEASSAPPSGPPFPSAGRTSAPPQARPIPTTTVPQSALPPRNPHAGKASPPRSLDPRRRT